MITKYALLMGFVTGVAILFFNQELQNIFHTKNCINVYDFGFGIPFYLS
jgi:hypothetical protein